ncbi:MAG: bifunctional demethylmenaquinone methyltransferase/2-methoxy-6-polyprenyl-1,4-benzoquinol methylase UbiE [Bacteroidales bacterium]|nr:bifunctional demethylmenaquinone methyltransferase/2-methoxy-6-polyprenyl-1,4-benzoquinol methylase UbiE [Bacteroidales bacterium]
MAYNFDTIARTYDRLNRVMTLGMDRYWRKRAVRGLHGNVLDVACGTGDMVLSLVGRGCTVTGVDISEEMLAIAKRKTASANFQLSTFNFQLGNAEALPFADGEFDAVTCAFGVCNFVHLEKGLNEMMRVLKPGGTMVILELATPDNPLIRPFYNLYTKHIIPWLGSRIAGNRDAYTYLPESIERFPKGDAFLQIIQHSTFNIQRLRQRKLTLGVSRLYTVQKD